MVLATFALAAATVLCVSDARADDDDRVHFRLGARGLLAFRHDAGYFSHARVFVESPSTSTRGAHLIGDPVPPAGGVAFEAGAELLPRFSLMASFRTMTNGIKTGDDTRLSITSTAWLLDARFAVLRGRAEMLLAQLELVAGTGRFSIREELVDRGLFDGTKSQTAASIGGRFGADASLYIGPAGVVIGYAYEIASASVGDRLGGRVDAGAHELTFGLAARFLRPVPRRGIFRYRRRHMSARTTVASVALAVAALLPRDALALEASGEVGASGGFSTWRGDATMGAQLRLALRFSRVVAVDIVTWEQLASVDRRVNTGLTLGVTGFLPLDVFRPFARVFAIHQHEEGLVSVQAHPWGTIFGIGAGIRHRAGGGASLGVEIPFRKSGSSELYAVGGLTSVWFPDATLGPSAYFTAYAGVGGTFELTVAQ